MTSIILYTQPECPPCQIVKLFFQDRGVSFEEKNIAFDAKAKEELLNCWNSMTTPTVIINGEVIRGFELALLETALQNNGL